MDIGDGAWCWFNEPRALTTEDVTILGWVGRDGDIRVASYNNETGAVVKRTLHQQLQVDDHANPAFYLRQDGRITAFYSRHAGRPLYHRTTTEPARIANWGPERTVPVNTPGGYGYTYPNPIWSPLDQKLYLFWRGGNFLPTLSTSDGRGGDLDQRGQGDGRRRAAVLTTALRQVRLARRRDPPRLHPVAPPQPRDEHLLPALRAGKRLGASRRDRRRAAPAGPHRRRPRLQRVGLRDARVGPRHRRGSRRPPPHRLRELLALDRVHRSPLLVRALGRRRSGASARSPRRARRSTPTARSCTRPAWRWTTRTRRSCTWRARRATGSRSRCGRRPTTARPGRSRRSPRARSTTCGRGAAQSRGDRRGPGPVHARSLQQLHRLRHHDRADEPEPRLAPAIGLSGWRGARATASIFS